MRLKERERRPMLQTAARGAVAGVAGGLAVTLVEREVLSRLVGAPRHRTAWDDIAARGLSAVGLDVRARRTKIASGIVSQIVLAGALGAVYAVLREQTSETRAGRMLLDGALTYAASLVFPDLAPPKRGHRVSPSGKMVRAASPGAAFSGVTAIALGALTRR